METTRNPNEAMHEHGADRMVRDEAQGPIPEPGRARVAIYLRVAAASPDGEYGLEAQRHACETYAEQHGLQVERVFKDRGVSAMTLERPGLDALRAAVGQGAIDVVVMASLDRLSRSAADLQLLSDELARAGVALHPVCPGRAASLEDIPVMRTMTAVLAMNEHDRLVQRMADGKREARRRRLEAAAHRDNPAAMRRIYALYTKGDGAGPLSPAEIAARLNRQGVGAAPLRVALYARAARQCDAVQQLADLRAAAESCGWIVARALVNHSTGWGLDRPELWALRDAARAGAIDLILVTGMDRLARSRRDLEALRDELRAVGCAIATVTASRITVDAPDGVVADADVSEL